MVLVLCTIDCNNDQGLDWNYWSQWENLQLPNSLIRESIPATKRILNASDIKCI